MQTHQLNQVDSEGINVVSLSIFKIIEDLRFKETIEKFGWYQNTNSTQGFEYYNSANACKLLFEQKGTTVRTTFRNMTAPSQNGEIIQDADRLFSSYNECLGWVMSGLQYFANFNPFNQMNQGFQGGF